MFLRVLLYGFLAYLLFKLVFDLIIPVYKTTKKIKAGFREMHARAEEQMNNQQQSASSSTQKAASKEKAGDYIDFEEVK